MKTIPAVRFMRYVDPRPSERGCWLWVGTVNSRGRGVFNMGTGQAINASRAAYALFRDASILSNPQMYVCHTCDVGLCVNPDHLFPGTATDNMRPEKADSADATFGAPHWNSAQI